TNEDLKAAVEKGEFREDLYYRLNEFKIELPALRERRNDLMDFAHYFLKQSNESLGKNVSGFSEETEAKILNYFWHGNLRELKNVIKRATLLSNGDKIEVNSLPEEII